MERLAGVQIKLNCIDPKAFPLPQTLGPDKSTAVPSEAQLQQTESISRLQGSNLLRYNLRPASRVDTVETAEQALSIPAIQGQLKTGLPYSSSMTWCATVWSRKLRCSSSSCCQDYSCCQVFTQHLTLVSRKTSICSEALCRRLPISHNHSIALLGSLWGSLLMLTAEMPEVMEAAERGQAEACSPSEQIPDVITQVRYFPCQLFLMLLAFARLL